MYNKIDMQKYYKFLVYVVVLILINLVATNMFLRVDLTSNGLYSLSNASKKVVSTLNDPLTINVFFSKNIPAPHNNIERYLHDLLEEYNLHASKYFNYRFFNVTADEENLTEKAKKNRDLAQSYGIYPVNVQTFERDETTVKRVYMGIVIIHGDLIERLEAVTATDGLEYKITSAIQKMNNKISALLGLQEKIQVNLVKSAKLDKMKGIDQIEEALKKIIKKLQKNTYGKLELVNIDPANTAISDKIMNRYKRFTLSWTENEKKEDGTLVPRKEEGILALGLKYRERSVEKRLVRKSIVLTQNGMAEQYSLIKPEEIEKFIEENIANVLKINEEIGYLTSHQTLTLTPNLPPQLAMMQRRQPGDLQVFNEMVGKNYSIKEVDLKNGEIPESIDTLIIAGAKDNFTDWELYQIDQFLMKGKSLAILADPFREIKQNQGGRMGGGMQQPIYLPLSTGLEKLLDFYGIKAQRSYLMDRECFVNKSVETGEMSIYFAPKIINENIQHSYDFMSNIKLLYVAKIAPLKIDDKKLEENDITANLLFSSSPQAWEMTGRITLYPMLIRPPQDKDKFRQYPLAYILEGKFNSFFADKDIPKKPEKEEKKETKKDEKTGKKTQAKKTEPVKKSSYTEAKNVIKKGDTSKIFMIGSSEIIKDNILIGAQMPNSIFIMNVLDYLNNNEDIAVMRAKKQVFNPLNKTEVFTRRFIQYFNVVAIPFIIIILGILIWMKRKTRRKNIKQIFFK